MREQVYCDRCGRGASRNRMLHDGWQLTYQGGDIAAAVCDRCQTPEEVHAAEKAAAATARWRSMTEGRLVDGEALRRVNALAAAQGGAAAPEGYFDHFPGLHVGIRTATLGAECLTGWLPVRELPVADYVDFHGEDVPVLAREALPALDGVPAFVFISARVTDWLGWPRCAVDDGGRYQEAANSAGRGFVSRALGET